MAGGAQEERRELNPEKNKIKPDITVRTMTVYLLLFMVANVSKP